MIIIAGHLNIGPRERDRYVEAHVDLVKRGRSFTGCVDLAIAADPVDPGRVNNLEIWESSEALDAWRSEAAVPEHGIEILGGNMQRFDATDGGPLF